MKTHVCDSCRGLGCLRCTAFRSCADAPHVVCPACNGLGSLPDQMPASDAIADAATVLTLTIGTFNCWGGITDAVLLGNIARRKMRGEPITSNNDAGCSASRAAHGAFTAFPGLREPIR